MADDLFRKHKDAFLTESVNHIGKMNASLLKLERDPEDSSLLYEIFRAAHTLKSMAATMNFNQMAQLAHAIEDLLDAVRNDNLPIGQYTDTLFECFDVLSASVKEISDNEKELDTQALVQRLQDILNHEEKVTKPIENSNKKIIFPVMEKIKTIEVKVDRLDTLMKLVEELLVSRIKLELLRETLNNHELTAAVDNMGRYLTDLQYTVMQVRLVPIGFLFNRFPRMVRDIGKSQNKDIDLQIEGGDIELDRTLIDEIGESLVHLIRNAIDHGIESADERSKNKKPERSNIVLSAKRTKEFVQIEVRDDGEGLDLPKIKSEAIRKNVLPPTASDADVMNSIFRGVSTTKKVTSLSGRGLGLSIVKQKIDSIGGSIQIKSKFGEGTSFVIRIPLTLAVIKVLFVSVNGQIYAIPINNIERLLTVSADEIKGMLNFNAIIYQDEDIPVTHLARLFSGESTIMSNYPVVVIRQEDKRFGLVVDSLLSTQEVVIKPLSKVVKENRYFSGTALIGSGEMVLIIDVDQLYLSRRQLHEWRGADAI